MVANKVSTLPSRATYAREIFVEWCGAKQTCKTWLEKKIEKILNYQKWIVINSIILLFKNNKYSLKQITHYYNK